MKASSGLGAGGLVEFSDGRLGGDLHRATFHHGVEGARREQIQERRQVPTAIDHQLEQGTVVFSRGLLGIQA